MLTPRNRSRLALIMIALATAAALPGPRLHAQAARPAAPADPIEEKLDKARADHRTKINAIRKDVVASLDRKIADARKQGNKPAVDRLDAEKTQFTDDESNIPPSLAKRGPVVFKQIRNAHLALDKAYQRAISDYTRAGKDAQADAIKTEREAFRLKYAAITRYRREPEDQIEQPLPNVPVQRPLLFDQKILIASAWNFTMIGQTTQKGGFKIVDGQIRHTDNDTPAGFAEFDDAGRLHLIFQNHRRIPAGEALVAKVANGQGRGFIDCNFDRWRFELVRVR